MAWELDRGALKQNYVFLRALRGTCHSYISSCAMNSRTAQGRIFRVGGENKGRLKRSTVQERLAGGTKEGWPVVLHALSAGIKKAPLALPPKEMHYV